MFVPRLHLPIALLTLALLAPPAAADSDYYEFHYRDPGAAPDAPVQPCSAGILHLNCDSAAGYAFALASWSLAQAQPGFHASCSWCSYATIYVNDAAQNVVTESKNPIFKVNGQICRRVCEVASGTVDISLSPLDFTGNEIVGTWGSGNLFDPPQWATSGVIYVYFW